jgi:Mg2+ and Co2+ transporter CorA
MNFEHMPELGLVVGYPLALLMMLAATSATLTAADHERSSRTLTLRLSARRR